MFFNNKVEPEVADKFVNDICFGICRKEALMQPIPMQAGRIKFTIERNQSGLNKIQPYYNLYFEGSQGKKVLVLYGKKRAFNRTTNFLISLSKDANDRESNMCVGKLRAN